MGDGGVAVIVDMLSSPLTNPPVRVFKGLEIYKGFWVARKNLSDNRLIGAGKVLISRFVLYFVCLTPGRFTLFF